MNIPPLIPDGYNGPIKQLTCRICKHVFYLTQGDYHRLPGAGQVITRLGKLASAQCW